MARHLESLPYFKDQNFSNILTSQLKQGKRLCEHLRLQPIPDKENHLKTLSQWAKIP